MRRITAPFLTLFVVYFFLQIPPAALAGHIVIDGLFTDWAAEACFSDPGLADDEASPARADITEFCSSAESGSLFMIMAWDDTRFQGGNASTAAVTTRGANDNYYRIYTTAEGSPGSAGLDSLLINTCGTDPACASETEVCDNTDADTLNDCSGAAAGSSPAWADPWGGRPSPGCSGTDCGTQDTAVELLLPWALVGGEPLDGQSVFLDYASYPSGPGQGQKDDTGANGIVCENQSGVFVCFPATPTAVTVSRLKASDQPASWGWGPIVLGLATLALTAHFLRSVRRSTADLGRGRRNQRGPKRS